MRHLPKIADYFGTTVDAILNGETNKQETSRKKSITTMDTVSRICELMNKNNIKDAELERSLGIGNKIVYGWKKGRSKSYMDYLPQLAKIFHVSVTYLLCLTDYPNELPSTMGILNDHISEEPKYLREETLDHPPGLSFQTFPLSESTVAMIPIVSTVRAGWNGVPEPVYDGMMAVYDQKNPQEYVWMKVEGDSMEPYIMEGDFVLVHIQPTAENGELVVAMLDGEEGTVKKFQRNKSGVMLVPYNSKCPTVFVPNDRLDAFLIYGVVKKSMRNYT
nr:MAG TPA: Repressor protein CI [Caudoviricetes sp.]